MGCEHWQTLAARLRADLPDVPFLDPAERPELLTDWRGRFHGQAMVVALPRSVDEVAALIQWCRRHQVAITPQGGNTGLCGGATPGNDRPHLLLSLRMLKAIRRLYPLANLITAEAGVTVAELQRAAATCDRLFALSLASEGSATLGGVISTNAGGVHVVRYGTMRAQVLGIEAVLADGSVVSRLHGLRKDNTGYAWEQLLIGSEGTLGVVTAATVRLFPQPRWVQTVWVALPDLATVAPLFQELSATFGERLSAFELMNQEVMGLVLRHIPQVRLPWTEGIPSWSVLVELTDTVDLPGLSESANTFWQQMMERGMIAGAVLAMNETQRSQFWRFRESASEAQQREGTSLKHDIALPLAELVPFIQAAEHALVRRCPGVRIVCFGHFGDGNLHYNLFLPVEAGCALSKELTRWVHDEVVRRDGSFSAEHGIGQLKVGEMRRYKNPAELALMQRIKKALDPEGLLNPGKVIPMDEVVL